MLRRKRGKEMCSRRVSLMIKPSVYELAKEQAEQFGMSVNAYIGLAIEAAATHEDLLDTTGFEQVLS